MSYLTEYFDEYRAFDTAEPAKIIRPESRYVALDGNWLDLQSKEKIVWTTDEVDAFIQKTLGRMRNCSTYRDDYCSNETGQEMKTDLPEYWPRPKRGKCKDKLTDIHSGASIQTEIRKGAPKDSELNRQAREMYSRHLKRLVMAPLAGQYRLFGTLVPRTFQCGLSEYQDTVSRQGYEELVRPREPQLPSVKMSGLDFKMEALPYESNRC